MRYFYSTIFFLKFEKITKQFLLKLFKSIEKRVAQNFSKIDIFLPLIEIQHNVAVSILDMGGLILGFSHLFTCTFTGEIIEEIGWPPTISYERKVQERPIYMGCSLSNQPPPACALQFLRYQKKWNALRVHYFVFTVMNTIFHYDLVSISLNDKIIRYMFQAKN